MATVFINFASGGTFQRFLSGVAFRERRQKMFMFPPNLNCGAEEEKEDLSTSTVLKPEIAQYLLVLDQVQLCLPLHRGHCLPTTRGANQSIRVAKSRQIKPGERGTERNRMLQHTKSAKHKGEDKRFYCHHHPTPKTQTKGTTNTCLPYTKPNHHEQNKTHHQPPTTKRCSTTTNQHTTTKELTGHESSPTAVGMHAYNSSTQQKQEPQTTCLQQTREENKHRNTPLLYCCGHACKRKRKRKRT